MDESKEASEKKKLGVSRPGKLEIRKTVEGGQVRQSFSHGRSKVVAVEVRRKRTYAVDSGGKATEVKGKAPGETAPVAEGPTPAPVAERLDAHLAADHLTTQEKAARVRALKDAKKTGVESAPGMAMADGAPALEDEPLSAEDAKRKEKEEDERRRVEEEAKRKADEAEAKRREEAAKVSGAVAAAKLEALTGAEEPEDEEKKVVRRPGVRPARPALTTRRTEPRRRTAKLTVTEALGDRDERIRSLASVRRARERERLKALGEDLAEPKKFVREVIVPETLTVQELANRMAVRSADVIKSLMAMGVMATINEAIDADTAELIVAEFGHTARRVSDADIEVGLKGADDDTENLKPRAPVVTVMGHVDHGKTSLLDALRETDVAAHEAGGITQHIGAYQVTLASGRKITFIDTPGHAAFTEMRARGASVTDVVILVVAGDDGIMPQTVEAIAHAKAAKAPIIVAINKMDKPDADAERVRQGLLQHDLVIESLGGDVLAIEVSATKKMNLDKLEEAILLQAEILDLKANPDRPAEGAVVESKMVQGLGAVATVLVQRGTLRIGDVFVCGAEWGRVRGLVDWRGETIPAAGPSVPVEIQGLVGLPNAGDDFSVVDSETRARQVSEFRQRRIRNVRAAASARGTVDQLLTRMQEGQAKRLPVVVKADAHGSAEAIAAMLEKLGTDEVKVEVLHYGVGAVNESDVTLARASKALIIGFNVRANREARELSKRDGIEIRYYSIIYEVADDLKKGLSGLLSPQIRETALGTAEIREVFAVSKVGKIAGCLVTDGVVRRGAKVRLLRDNVVIHEGQLSQLKRFKDDVREVRSGTECGMAFESFQDMRKGDVVECFEVESVAREL